MTPHRLVSALLASLPTLAPAAPIDAGIDQQVNIGTVARLTGSALNLHNQAMASPRWTQLAGPAVSLSNPQVVNPTFTAPSVASDTELRFRFEAVDAQGQAVSDEVSVLVRAVAANQPPVLTGGATRTVYKHAATTTCIGGLDYDGQVVARQWTQLAGPRLRDATLDPNGSCLSYTVPGISRAKEVVFEVQATDNGGASSRDLLTLWLHPQLPAVQPTVAVGGGYLQLNWAAVRQAERYEVCRADVPVDDVALCASLPGGRLSTVRGRQAWQDRRVQPGQTYHYALRALEADGTPGRSGPSRSATALAAATRWLPQTAYAQSPVLSANGRWLAFTTQAALLPEDRNGLYDVYLLDRLTTQLSLVSVTPAGLAGNGRSMAASISADGRLVAFESEASDLVDGDTNGHNDVFVRDLRSGSTQWVSSGGNGHSRSPGLSGDGRWVAYVSEASNLVAGDGNGAADVFTFDRVGGQTRRVSVRSGGAESGGVPPVMNRAPSLSDDGQRIAFVSSAGDLVPGDGNGEQDAFVHDLGSQTTVRVGTLADVPALSGDGRTVFFASWDQGLTPVPFSSWAVFSRSLDGGELAIESVNADGQGSNQMSFWPSASRDGRYLAFDSFATNLLPGTGGLQQAWRRDRLTGMLVLLSQSHAGTPGNGASRMPALAATQPQAVVFVSVATNLDPLDPLNGPDLYVREAP